MTYTVDPETRREREWRALRWCLAGILIFCMISLIIAFYVFKGGARVGIAILLPFLAAFVGLCFAPDVINRLSQNAGEIIWSTKPGEIEPIYSAARTLANRGKYTEAIAEYESIMEEFPEVAKPYIEIINIALMKLHDQSIAETYYTRGMKMLQRQGERDVLRHMYGAIQSRLNRRGGRVIPRDPRGDAW
jgi:tetratricopeptide (TPR) repeat protein